MSLKRCFSLSISICLLTIILSCEKLIELPSGGDITLTYYDTSVYFPTYKSFLLRDSVAIIGDSDSSLLKGQENEISSIIPQIAAQLLTRGFQQVDTISEADFAVNVGLANLETNQISDLPIWTDGQKEYLEWYSGGYPVWGSFQGFWYPWTYQEFDTKTGLLEIEIVDAQSIRDITFSGSTNEPQSDIQPDFLWKAIISGIVEEDKFIPDKASKYINEAFSQSTYLHSKN